MSLLDLSLCLVFIVFFQNILLVPLCMQVEQPISLLFTPHLNLFTPSEDGLPRLGNFTLMFIPPSCMLFYFTIDLLFPLPFSFLHTSSYSLHHYQSLLFFEKKKKKKVLSSPTCIRNCILLRAPVISKTQTHLVNTFYTFTTWLYFLILISATLACE